MTGEFPDMCNAKVTLVYKINDFLDCSNHRPISLLSNLNKTFEKCVYARIFAFLMKYKLICKRQFGNGYSTNHALVSLIEISLIKPT